MAATPAAKRSLPRKTAPVADALFSDDEPAVVVVVPAPKTKAAVAVVPAPKTKTAAVAKAEPVSPKKSSAAAALFSDDDGDDHAAAPAADSSAAAATTAAPAAAAPDSSSLASPAVAHTTGGGVCPITRLVKILVALYALHCMVSRCLLLLCVCVSFLF